MAGQIVYVGDVGGNVWRLDMTVVSFSDWRMSKLAVLGGGHTADENASSNARRFFGQPVIVRSLRLTLARIRLLRYLPTGF